MAALAGGRPVDPLRLTIAFGLACSLVYQFRLWDDISDRERDRLDHPERVLSTTTSVTSFRSLVSVAFLLNLALITVLSGPRWRLEAFMLLNGAFLLWYRWLRQLWRNEIASSHVVVSKYPVFVYLLSGEPSRASGVHLLLAMLLVYFCFCVYELLHDARLYRAPEAPRILALEMLAWCAVSAIMAIALVDRGALAAMLQGVMSVAGGFVLVMLFMRHRARLQTDHGNYAVFVISFFQLLTFSLGGGP